MKVMKTGVFKEGGTTMIFDMDFKIKSREDIHSMIIFGSYMVIMVALTLFGAYGMSGSDAMGYSFLTYYMVLPAGSFIAAMFLGNRRHPIKWIAPFIFAVVGYVMPLPVFGYSLLFNALMAFIPAVIGFLIGLGIQAIQLSKSRKKAK
ncbi:MAG: hypothetical protein IKL07_08090 [Clostridium sp.]|nr:hypothetical protein [Clostridium sp.]